MQVRHSLSLFLLCAVSVSAAVAESAIKPPSRDFRQVERSVEAGDPFDLIRAGRPAFQIVVSDPGDEILSTAASDFARYFESRWGATPQIENASTGQSESNLIVLASTSSLDRLPAEFQAAATRARDLHPQAYVIQKVNLPDHHSALLCLGGSPIGARYASIELLRRMQFGRLDASFAFSHIRDEPYFPWRAIYINDSAHQANNYDPNLIYPVGTNRWSLEKWERYIDQMAFFRYNVLQIWLVPEMFSPKALKGGSEYDYVRDTINAVARYAKPRGIELEMLNGINVSVDQGTLLNTLSPVYKDMPIYRYLSPNKPEEKSLMLAFWDYWSKALPEVKLWALFPGDPGGCAEQGCGPETYVDLSIEISRIIRKNNPQAIIDVCPWQFFGWGPTWFPEFRKDTARIDRGYRYLVSKIDAFPPNTIFSPNLNDFTSEAHIDGAAGRGGNTVQYIDAIHQKGRLLHTWTYFVTEGEGWLNHHDKVDAILRARAIEAKYPISGGICYTMTPTLNLLNQYACAEAYWNPHVTSAQVMRSFTEGVFGTSEKKLIDIFPGLDVGPIVGYTFVKAPDWNPDFPKLQSEMSQTLSVLDSLSFDQPARFNLVIQPQDYAAELGYFAGFYKQAATLGEAVQQARGLVHSLPQYNNLPESKIGMVQAGEALPQLSGEKQKQLAEAVRRIGLLGVLGMKNAYRAKHYKIFLDYPTPFTEKLPILIDGLFDSFGADFVTSE